MDSLIQLAQQMNWPFAAAAVGIAASVGVSVMVVRISSNERANRRVSADAEVKKAEIAVSVKNGSVPAVRDY
jgi:hypothetical protein